MCLVVSGRAETKNQMRSVSIFSSSFYQKLPCIFNRNEQKNFTSIVNVNILKAEKTGFCRKIFAEKECCILRNNTTVRIVCALLAGLLALGSAAGCAQTKDEAPVSSYAVADTTPMETVLLEDEAVALAEAPAALPAVMSTVASGTLVKANGEAKIDYSNTADGYVMVLYSGKSTQRLKAQVKGPGTAYTYNLSVGEWAAFPLSDGNGSYQITVYKNVSGSKYAAVLSLSTKVELKDEFAPFLHSNQYVDYDAAPETVAKAAELCETLETPLEKVAAVYDYVVKSLSYDKELAKTVKSGYLPVLDEVLEKKSGICFDYAALMTGMLRSQGVPCKLVVGYAGTAYHAWISVWTEDSGWVNGVVFFDGSAWQRMDPTFASSGKQSASIMSYIGDGENYSAKYFY